MSGDYALLAPIYTSLGMADFAEQMTARLIDLAHKNDWMGRRILEMGAGTGVTLEWLTRHNYIVLGLDNAPEMLEICRKRLEDAGLHHDVQQGDIRNSSLEPGRMDLVLALDVINELNNLRDLESVFNTAYNSLADGRLFIFDLHTIQGLTERGAATDEIAHDSANLAVITANHYDYDRQVHERRFLVFAREGETWNRAEGSRVLRGYPTQAVASLLQRCGFQIRSVTNTDFEDFEPGVSQAQRVIFVAEKH